MGGRKQMEMTGGQGPSEKNHDNEQTRLLRKLNVYTKLANYDNIRKRLVVVLDSNDKKRVFEATDGNNSVRDIQSKTGVNKDTVSNWWNEWQKEGIVEESKEARGRRYKVFSLSDFGIEAPTSRKQRKAEKTE